VLELGQSLVASGVPSARVLGSELVHHHAPAMQKLRASAARKLAGRLESWSDVDVFACAIAGQAFRDGRLPEAEILRWARSRDHFWRRAALVSTVPLNVKAQGGSGDAPRTLRVCRALVSDREDLVVKALSWALRALAERDPAAVRRFLALNHARLAPRVRREVGHKLRTGRKNP
jgi:3-methyladenine DNA glycosylase AlkD